MDTLLEKIKTWLMKKVEFKNGDESKRIAFYGKFGPSTFWTKHKKNSCSIIYPFKRLKLSIETFIEDIKPVNIDEKFEPRDESKMVPLFGLFGSIQVQWKIEIKGFCHRSFLQVFDFFETLRWKTSKLDLQKCKKFSFWIFHFYLHFWKFRTINILMQGSK